MKIIEGALDTLYFFFIEYFSYYMSLVFYKK